MNSNPKVEKIMTRTIGVDKPIASVPEVTEQSAMPASILFDTPVGAEQPTIAAETQSTPVQALAETDVLPNLTFTLPSAQEMKKATSDFYTKYKKQVNVVGGLAVVGALVVTSYLAGNAFKNNGKPVEGGISPATQEQNTNNGKLPVVTFSGDQASPLTSTYTRPKNETGINPFGPTVANATAESRANNGEAINSPADIQAYFKQNPEAKTALSETYLNQPNAQAIVDYMKKNVKVVNPSFLNEKNPTDLDQVMARLQVFTLGNDQIVHTAGYNKATNTIEAVNGVKVKAGHQILGMVIDQNADTNDAALANIYIGQAPVAQPNGTATTEKVYWAFDGLCVNPVTKTIPVVPTATPTPGETVTPTPAVTVTPPPVTTTPTPTVVHKIDNNSGAPGVNPHVENIPTVDPTAVVNTGHVGGVTPAPAPTTATTSNSNPNTAPTAIPTPFHAASPSEAPAQGDTGNKPQGTNIYELKNNIYAIYDQETKNIIAYRNGNTNVTWQA